MELAQPLLDERERRPLWRRPVSLALSALAMFCIGAGVLLGRAHSNIEAPPPPAAAVNEPGSRLRIVNGCSDPLWIANFAGAAPYFPQDIKLAGGSSHDFDIPVEGLAATRFWPKWGCDKDGQNCKVGGSGGPGESCIAAGCVPPVDSKFEASFGCLAADPARCAPNPSDPTQKLGADDWWDVSQVDGWTLPYKVEVFGDCDAPRLVDCSSLSLASCPEHEDLGKLGTQSLKVLDPNGGGEVVGCYSPCAKFTYSNWDQGYGFTPESPEAQNYCCPTPPITPDQCHHGPVIHTAYVEAVHRLCPSVYAYAYDDGVGLSKCPAGTRRARRPSHTLRAHGSPQRLERAPRRPRRYQATFYCPA